MNYAYTYPPHIAWQSPNAPEIVEEGQDRNGNIGKILPALIQDTGLKCVEANIFQPLLIEPEVRHMLLKNECLDNKESQLKEGRITEQEWQEKHDSLKSCIEDKNTMIGFYAGNFTASRKGR